MFLFTYIFCCIPPVVLLRVLFPTVGNRTRRRTGGIQQKIIQYARDCLYRIEKSELLMMSSLKLETCTVKDD